MYNIIGRRKIWYLFSAILIGASLWSLSTWGLKFGIDFTGGSLEVLSFEKRPSNQDVLEVLGKLDLGDISIKPTETSDVIVRFKSIDEKTHQKVLKALNDKFGKVEEKSFDSIGPVIGEELKNKSLSASLVVIFGIAVYIAWAFRKVSKPVESWKYGVTTIVTFFHDAIIPIGVFSVLGHYKGVEIDTPFVAAILTIIGFSVHDTIVVFDRTRENLLRFWTKDFATTVNNSVNETLVRSFNTTLTTIFALFAIYLFGGDTIKYFALALIVGFVTGAYSSVFIASPLLLEWYNWAVRKNR